jgi:hypothetical protein
LRADFVTANFFRRGERQRPNPGIYRAENAAVILD